MFQSIACGSNQLSYNQLFERSRNHIIYQLSVCESMATCVRFLFPCKVKCVDPFRLKCLTSGSSGISPVSHWSHRRIIELFHPGFTTIRFRSLPEHFIIEQWDHVNNSFTNYVRKCLRHCRASQIDVTISTKQKNRSLTNCWFTCCFFSLCVKSIQAWFARRPMSKYISW